MEHKKECCKEAVSYALRVAVGGLLLLMGIAKFKMGVGVFVDSMTPIFDGTIMPMGVATGFLTVVPLFEVLAGGLIILGLFTRTASLAAAFYFSLLVAGLASTANPDMYVMMTNNFIYMFAAIWLANKGAGRFSLDKVVCGDKCKY